MFRFAAPWFLGLLPVLALLSWHWLRTPSRSALRVGSSAILGGLPPSPWVRVYRVLPWLKIAALALAVIALARPQQGSERVEMLTEGINIVLAVDLSRSMNAMDFSLNDTRVNRLEAVKDVVARFVAERSGDRIGLVVFGSEAYTQLPLTRDYDAIVSTINKLEIGAAGPKTAVGDALGISLKRLEDVESTSNVVILLTDGKSNMGELSPQTAADAAASRGVTVHTIGVGSNGMAPFEQDHPLFGRQVVQARVELDTATLKDIARRTGGRFFQAKDTDALTKVYAAIDSMEKSEAKVLTHAEYNDLYQQPLCAALALLGLWCVLATTRLGRMP